MLLLSKLAQKFEAERVPIELVHSRTLALNDWQSVSRFSERNTGWEDITGLERGRLVRAETEGGSVRLAPPWSGLALPIYIAASSTWHAT